MTATARGGKEICVTVLAVHGPPFLHKAHICQRAVTVGAGELILVPGFAHGYQERTPVRKHANVTPVKLSKNQTSMRPRRAQFCISECFYFGLSHTEGTSKLEFKSSRLGFTWHRSRTDAVKTAVLREWICDELSG